MRVVLFFLVFFFSPYGFSDCNGVHCTNVKVTRLVVTDSGISVGTSGEENQLNCDSGKYNYLKLDSNSRNYNSIYSLILSAHTIEHPIWIRVSDEPTCKISYVVSDR